MGWPRKGAVFRRLKPAFEAPRLRHRPLKRAVFYEGGPLAPYRVTTISLAASARGPGVELLS